MSKSVQLFLHANGEASGLNDAYRRALTSATELLIVSAYLTNWDSTIPLNKGCERFRMIVGKDFGITRKAACKAVLEWTPARQKVHFRVADQIDGFHPKAVFWREKDGQAYAIIGSSNLSLAAFESNYEANIALPVSSAAFDQARLWVDQIAALSVPMSSDWLENYEEGASRGGKRTKSGRKKQVAEVLPIRLPWPKGAAEAVRARRKQLGQYRENRDGLIELFRQCAAGTIRSSTFYAELPSHWGGEVGGRFQGKGWERQGKVANFRKLAESYLKIIDAKPAKRDDVAVAEIDRLAQQKNPARRAFLSEMLCLEFPELYPVLNQPVQLYLSDVKFRGSSGMTEGAKYLDLALRLRLSLAQNPQHPAKSIAELDTVIWLAYPPPPKR
jgi:HKD family nuclease